LARFPRTAALALALSASPCALSADLLEVYRAAQSSDATYASARAAWAAGQEKLPQGLSGLLPSASLSGSTQQNDRDLRFRTPGLVGGESQFNTNALNVTITQPVYRRQNMVAFEQSKTQVAQSDAVFATSAQDLIVRVAQAYFDVLLAQDSVAFAQAQLSAIGQQLEQAKRNFEVGTATITDTHEARARYDITLSAEIAARNDLEIKKRALEVIIGRQAPGLIPLGDRFSPRLPDPNNMQNWAELALRSNLQVRAAEASLTFASQEVGRNRGGHHPTADVFATYSNTGSAASTPGAVGGGTDITTRIIGLQFAIPLYQGGAVSSRVREAVANEDRARQDLESARRQAELSVRQAFLGVTGGLSQVKALEAALVSSRSSLDSTRLGQEVGVRTQVDVLNAQQQLFQTRRDLAQAKYNYILALLRLKSAAGQLTEQDVALVNAWLDR